MGVLAKSLQITSSYAAKKTGIWDEITDRIANAQTPPMLRDVEGWLLAQTLHIPDAWEEPILEMLEKRAEEIEAEEIGAILRDRYDFS
jgi:hypothetical protein